jgi:hypothetical protein
MEKAFENLRKGIEFIIQENANSDLTIQDEVFKVIGGAFKGNEHPV